MMTSCALKRQFNINDRRSLEAALKQVVQDATLRPDVVVLDRFEHGFDENALKRAQTRTISTKMRSK